MRPLAGVRVLDLSRLLPGPFLTQLLCELGADVIKLEAPGLGDETRWIPPDVEGTGYAFWAVNRGKRSIVIDLKKPEGIALVERLARGSDVLVESFRPGVLARLGLPDERLAAINPRLVRCSLVGYPPGPWRDDVGHDLNYQSLAGILSHSAVPAPPSTQVADLGGALYAATGILGALLARERTGVGTRVEVALSDAAAAFNVLALARAKGGESAPGGWELTGTIPCYRTYRCADGRFVALAALEQKFFVKFSEATGLDESLQYDRSPEGHAQVEALFASRPAAEWVDTLRKAGVPITPVLDASEATASAAPAAPLTRASPEGTAPALGEHTDEILQALGIGADEIARLRKAGVVE